MNSQTRNKLKITSINTIIIILLFVSTSFAIKPDRNYKKTPKDFNLNFESVIIETSDNYKLFGWFIPAKQDSPKVTIIFSMMDGGNMSYLIEMIIYFVENNFNVLLYDYRGFGRSQDFQIERDRLIYPEFYIDLNAAIDFVKSKNDNKIILVGFSMGASISIGVASQRNDVTAVIADGAYTTTDEVITNLNNKYEKKEISRITLKPLNFEDKMQPINAVTSFSNTYLCVLTGSLDDITTPEMAYHIYSKCPNTNKGIWIAPNTKHCRIMENHGKLYFNFINTFIQQSLN